MSVLQQATSSTVCYTVGLSFVGFTFAICCGLKDVRKQMLQVKHIGSRSGSQLDIFHSPLPLEIVHDAWRHFWLSELGNVLGTCWAEVRGAAVHPTMHRKTPTTKNYLAPDVNSAKAGKPWAQALSLNGYLFTSSLTNTQELVGNAKSQAIPRPT